jgi:DNA invertase Pin-like site-specific DNA recombinase
MAKAKVPKGNRSILYLRVSTLEQLKGVSLEAQEERLRAYCQMAGLEDALRQTKAWDHAGVTLHLIDMGGASINTASAMGRILLTTMAGFAELERNLVAERTALSLTHKKSHHQVFNHVPFGFDQVGKMLVEDPGEIRIVKLIQERRDDGWSLHQIADALNEDRIPTKLHGRWHARTVKNILDSSLFATA